MEAAAHFHQISRDQRRQIMCKPTTGIDVDSYSDIWSSEAPSEKQKSK